MCDYPCILCQPNNHFWILQDPRPQIDLIRCIFLPDVLDGNGIRFPFLRDRLTYDRDEENEALGIFLCWLLSSSACLPALLGAGFPVLVAFLLILEIGLCCLVVLGGLFLTDTPHSPFPIIDVYLCLCTLLLARSTNRFSSCFLSLSFRWRSYGGYCTLSHLTGAGSASYCCFDGY